MCLPEAVRLCEKEGIHVDLSIRPLSTEPLPRNVLREKVPKRVARWIRYVVQAVALLPSAKLSSMGDEKVSYARGVKDNE
jgi:hypothetical protein